MVHGTPGHFRKYFFFGGTKRFAFIATQTIAWQPSRREQNIARVFSKHGPLEHHVVV